jgi:hypothetical protein
VAEPLASGRGWEIDPAINIVHEGRTLRTWLKDGQNPGTRALFKRPDPSGAEIGEIYSMGMERVCFTLGNLLGLPMPQIYLEDFEGNIGSVQLKVENSRNWKLAQGCPMLMNEIVNEDQLPLCFVFDAWVANIDRVDRNLLAQAEPPTKLPNGAQKCRVWLVDNGCTGLWFPSKFDSALLGEPVEKVDVQNGSIREDVQRSALGAMPQRYRQACRGIDTAGRDALLNHIREIPDTAIEAAVNEVPPNYISDQAKALTVAFLKLRRDEMAKIYGALVP